MEVQCFAEELQLRKESLAAKDSIVMRVTNKVRHPPAPHSYYFTPFFHHNKHLQFLLKIINWKKISELENYGQVFTK